MQATKAIVLKSINFQESGKILSLLSQDLGLIQCIIKTIPEKRYDLVQASSPLFTGIFHLKKSSSEIYSCKEVSINCLNDGLKSSYFLLKSIIDFIQVILKTQIKNRPLPLLYQLISVFFHEMNKKDQKESFFSSLLLKFLRHEGLLNFDHFSENTKVSLDKLQILALSTNQSDIYNLNITIDEFKEIQTCFYSVIKSQL